MALTSSESLTSRGLFANAVCRISRMTERRAPCNFSIRAGKCDYNHFNACPRHIICTCTILIVAQILLTLSSPPPPPSGEGERFLTSGSGKLRSRFLTEEVVSGIGFYQLRATYENLHRSRPVSYYKDDGYMNDERARDGGRGARWQPERKLLDHVDCFPSQPKWTYRLETSVLDVKIPVAALVSKLPLSLYRHHSFSLSLSHSANFLPFLRVYSRARARPFVRVRRKRCNGGWTRSNKSEILFSSI